ncbi:MAG: hypothetical protein GX076_03865 [Clostridiales bacterium]|nr:hypothetical protein [Clostridiales bacterium]
MTRLKKTIRNLVIIVVLLFLFMKLNGLYFSPVQALHASERDLHFGPSEIVHSFDHGNSRYFLTRYEGMISCSPIKRSLGVFWRYGAGHGVPNNEDRPVFTSYRSEGNNWIVYGMRNDSSIARVDIEVKNAEGEIQVYSSDTFYEDMFYIIWQGENESEVLFSQIFAGLKAYDDAGSVIYDSEIIL